MKVATVEDDFDIAQLLTITLRIHDIEVIVSYTNAADARRGAFWGEVDAAIVDFSMPGNNGAIFIDWLHEHHPNVRAVLVTAYPPSELPADIHHRADAVLHKPFGTEDLVAALRGP